MDGALVDRYVDQLIEFRGSYPSYSRSCLQIVNKDGDFIPFSLNRAQRHVHEQIEQQLFEYNHIRALVLKGRQQGISTYTEGRFYWRTSLNKGVRAFIMTHLADATDNLFTMVERYHKNNLDFFRPQTQYDSKKELKFGELDSGYKVGTAGSSGAGRSGTYKYFHGSEVAFWKNAEKHVAGALQTVGAHNGSEVIFESTANGPSGYFYKQWKKAEKGIGDFIAIFVPWYWQDEYRSTPPKGWKPTGDEADYQELFGLDLEQTYWMFNKNIEMGGDPGVLCNLFRQEYPATPTEAFQTSGHDSLIKSGCILKARKHTIEKPYGARVMGVDPSRFGDDRTSLIDRKGRKAYNLESHSKTSITQVAQFVVKRIVAAEEEGDPYAAVFVDEVGLGAGVVDILNDLGYQSLVIGVNAGGSASDKDKYVNKRAEMWKECELWLNGDMPVDIPDQDTLQADLMAPGYTHNMRQQLVIESKEQMRKRDSDIPSPDEAEALILTFAFPVSVAAAKNKSRSRNRNNDWRAT